MIMNPKHFMDAIGERRYWREDESLFSPESRRVFLNIPYHPEYNDLEIALCTVLIAYDLIPVIAKQSSRNVLILDKIIELIDVCGYGVSDLSFGHKLNIPFEHGIIVSKKGIKNACGIAKSRFLAHTHMSDMQGLLILEHKNNPELLVHEMSKWLLDNAIADIPRFRRDIPASLIVNSLSAVRLQLKNELGYATLAEKYDELLLGIVLADDDKNSSRQKYEH